MLVWACTPWKHTAFLMCAFFSLFHLLGGLGVRLFALFFGRSVRLWDAGLSWGILCSRAGSTSGACAVVLGMRCRAWNDPPVHTSTRFHHAFVSSSLIIDSICMSLIRFHQQNAKRKSQHERRTIALPMIHRLEPHGKEITRTPCDEEQINGLEVRLRTLL
jgi:hypothetical protein